jgi:hypothetical protein
MWHPQAFNPPPCSAAPRLQVLEAVAVLGIRRTNASMSIIAVFITCVSLSSGGHVTDAAVLLLVRLKFPADAPYFPFGPAPWTPQVRPAPSTPAMIAVAASVPTMPAPIAVVRRVVVGFHDDDDGRRDVDRRRDDDDGRRDVDRRRDDDDRTGYVRPPRPDTTCEKQHEYTKSEGTHDYRPPAMMKPINAK